MEEKYIIKIDKLMKKFLHRSRGFAEWGAFPYGMADLLIHGKKTKKLTYDHEYFSILKSTKTLESIRSLLKLGNNEDVFILVRSIFENYLSCRYLNENEDKLDEFLTNPLNVFYGNFIVQQDGKVVNRDKEVVGEQLNPTVFKAGKDKGYYYYFYGFLSTFSHSNFGISQCYMDDNLLFTLKKINYPLLSRVFTLFVFTKIFEHVVTVEGEDFLNSKVEKACYELVKESLELQYEVFPYLVEQYNGEEKGTVYQHKKMREMFKDMKKSLLEELGSIKKEIINDKLVIKYSLTK
ncbi:DUF5677 domain-containing protein [Niallia circulans]|uniref:DUF5677 domain-containing protein n=1 Tax=Niallia circulans TaxID=1397 RepID=UPI003D9597CB